MEDTRTCREVVIYRIQSYLDGMTFYDPEYKREYDYENMTDHEVVRTFELLMFDYVRVRNESRARQENTDRYRR